MSPLPLLEPDRDGRRVRFQVVVAHPDDETFGCGSLLLHAREAGAETAVVCATRGEAGEVSPDVTVPPGGVAALREGELYAAAAVLGVGTVELLDFTDSGMEGDPAPGTLCAADPARIETAVAEAVDRFRPDVLVTLDGGDGHRDHLRVRAATTRVAEARRLPLYLHCLPRSVMSRWAEHRAKVDPDSAYLRGLELGTPDEQVTDVLDTGRHLAARWEAIGRHRSQASPFDGLPEDVQQAFLTREHLIEVIAPR